MYFWAASAVEGIADLHHLPLHDFHAAHGAHFQPFAGYAMPIHYALGILNEHRHTRAAAGLFDVSHMGQIKVVSRTGRNFDAAMALETLVPADLLSLPTGRQRYALLTNASGGICDDLMIANLDSCMHLVVNAGCVSEDLEHLQRHLADRCDVELLSDRVLLALQGPAACAVLRSFVPSVAAMRFMDAAQFSIAGVECFVTRSGYTGEDGFEISLPAGQAFIVAELLSTHPQVELIGLGARDSLRLEAGLCLYGRDLDTGITPVEATLEWAIGAARRNGGLRAGGFPGANVILAQLARGASRLRVGLRPEKTPIRAGVALFSDPTSSEPIGQVTSGTYAPSVQGPVAMGYVRRSVSQLGARIYADVRGQRAPVSVSAMPFVPHRYHR